METCKECGREFDSLEAVFRHQRRHGQTAQAYVLEGKTRRYVPDFHIVTTSGADLLVEVKPPTLSGTETNSSKRQSALDFCARNGWTYFEWSRGAELPIPT